MRAETKERADTIICSVLRGSFTFYQATAGDMRGERERAGNQEGERAGETKRQQEKTCKFSVCKHFSDTEMIIIF